MLGKVLFGTGVVALGGDLPAGSWSKRAFSDLTIVLPPPYTSGGGAGAEQGPHRVLKLWFPLTLAGRCQLPFPKALPSTRRGLAWPGPGGGAESLRGLLLLLL